MAPVTTLTRIPYLIQYFNSEHLPYHNKIHTAYRAVRRWLTGSINEGQTTALGYIDMGPEFSHSNCHHKRGQERQATANLPQTN
jgi:hypothetical protein